MNDKLGKVIYFMLACIFILLFTLLSTSCDYEEPTPYLPCDCDSPIILQEYDCEDVCDIYKPV